MRAVRVGNSTGFPSREVRNRRAGIEGNLGGCRGRVALDDALNATVSWTLSRAPAWRCAPALSEASYFSAFGALIGLGARSATARRLGLEWDLRPPVVLVWVLEKASA